MNKYPNNPNEYFRVRTDGTRSQYGYWVHFGDKIQNDRDYVKKFLDSRYAELKMFFSDYGYKVEPKVDIYYSSIGDQDATYGWTAWIEE